MGKEKIAYTLDSFAILSYLKGEKSAGQIKNLLQRAKKGTVVLYLHEINLGEVQYIIHRERGEQESEKLIAWLRACPIKFVGIEKNITSLAAKIKAIHPISYADAFAVATAIQTKSQLVTGDPEMKSVESKVAVHWIEK